MFILREFTSQFYSIKNQTKALSDKSEILIYEKKKVERKLNFRSFHKLISCS